MDEVRCLHALEKAELTNVFGCLNILEENEPFFEKNFNKEKK